jgi:hypothetical protein
MRSKAWWWMVSAVGLVVLAAGIAALAQGPTPTHFSGSISDYTPMTISGKVVGPWVMNGTWFVDVKGRSGLADFSAAMSMELSDYAVVNGVVKDVDSSDPQVRIAHTHHITMKDATLSYATGLCPSYAPPGPATTNPGFVVTGMANITGNGGPAPFSQGDTVLSQLQVCVNGGTDVPFSNVTLVFGAPASGHFGSQPIHGVVRKAKSSDSDDGHHEHR